MTTSSSTRVKPSSLDCVAVFRGAFMSSFQSLESQ